MIFWSLPAKLIPDSVRPPIPADFPTEEETRTNFPRPAAPPDPTYRTPEESMKHFRFAEEGYGIELVASEPMVIHPVCCAWDGNGRLYVANMETYMQDIDGTDQYTSRSAITLLEDTDGDGRMDKWTKFVEKLMLPRVIFHSMAGW